MELIEITDRPALKKVILARETFNTFEKEHLIRVRVDSNGGETTATFHGIPVDIDDSMAPGEIEYVFEVKI